MQAQTDLAERQDKWETLQAVAVFLATVAVFASMMLAVGTWIHPSAPRQITVTVHLDAPLVAAPTGH